MVRKSSSSISPKKTGWPASQQRRPTNCANKPISCVRIYYKFICCDRWVAMLSMGSTLTYDDGSTRFGSAKSVVKSFSVLRLFRTRWHSYNRYLHCAGIDRHTSTYCCCVVDVVGVVVVANPNCANKAILFKCTALHRTVSERER